MKQLTKLFVVMITLLGVGLISRVVPLTQAQGLVEYIIVDGDLGLNDYFTSDVVLALNLPDGWELVGGCDDIFINFDTAGIPWFCQVKNPAGQIFGGEFILKRDATNPVVNANLSLDQNDPWVLYEGDFFQVDASGSIDLTSGVDQVSIQWDLDQDGFFEAQNEAVLPTQDGLAEGQSDPDFLVAQVADHAGNVAQATFWVEVVNVPPQVGIVAVPVEDTPLGGAVSIEVPFTDPGLLDTHNATIDWGDGEVTPGLVEPYVGGGTVTGEHIYLTPGTHTIEVAVGDIDGGVSTVSAAVTVMTFVGTIEDFLIPRIRNLANEGCFTKKGKGQVTSAITRLETAAANAKKVKERSLSRKEVNALITSIETMMETSRNSMQLASTEFEHFCQRSSQLTNMLTAVFRTMNDMRRGTIRNML